MMTESIQINATAEIVWNILTDVKSYAEWNPFFVEMSGKFEPGSYVKVSAQPVGGKQTSFSPKILEVKKNELIKWRGRVLLPYIFDGYHSFIIKRISDDKVEFTQHEDFKGILVPFIGLEPFQKGWVKMNNALKMRAEKVFAQEKSLVN